MNEKLSNDKLKTAVKYRICKSIEIDFLEKLF